MSDSPVLPSYSPSVPPPSYSNESGCDERTLQCTPRVTRSIPTGTYIKQSGKTTIALYEQQEDAQIPLYGRYGHVSGVAILENNDKITEVLVKVEGKLDSTFSEGGSSSVKVINDSYTLWEKNTEEAACPSQIPFSFGLPSTYTLGESEHPLPPSFESSHHGIPSIFVKCQYSINLRITRTFHRKVGFLTKTKCIRIPFQYHPRTRAHHPIVPFPCVFSALKTSPEEWYQASSIMKPVSSLPEPIHCHLFIPSSRVYSLSDKIPFHVQLNGPISAIRAFLDLPQLDRIISADSCLPTASTKKRGPSEPRTKVQLLRQVSVESRGQRASRSSVFGETQLWEVPPLDSLPLDSRDPMHLDWEGEVECAGGISIGGFSAGNVIVKDFIVLTLEPPDPVASPFLALKMMVPIRIVTDSWIETTD